MSSDPPSGAPSPRLSPASRRPRRARPRPAARRAAARGARAHLPGSREHADGDGLLRVRDRRRARLRPRRSAEADPRGARCTRSARSTCPPRARREAAASSRAPSASSVTSTSHSRPATGSRRRRRSRTVCGWSCAARERYDGAGPGGLAGERDPARVADHPRACACETRWPTARRGRPAEARHAALAGCATPAAPSSTRAPSRRWSRARSGAVAPMPPARARDRALPRGP